MVMKNTATQQSLTGNIFINMIYNKPSSGFFKKRKHKKEANKFRKEILDGSPGFGLLWRMSDFIKLAEDVFFYSNSLNNTEFGLYSSRQFEENQNGFKITDAEKGVVITIKLLSKSQHVIMEIDRINSFSKTTLSFTNEQWDRAPSIYDEMVLEHAIKIINTRIIKLFDHYYNAW